MDLFAKVTAEFMQQTLPYNSKVTIYFFPFLLRTQTSYLNNFHESRKETKLWNQNSMQSLAGKIITMAENFLRWGVTFQRNLITVCSPELWRLNIIYSASSEHGGPSFIIWNDSKYPHLGSWIKPWEPTPKCCTPAFVTHISLYNQERGKTHF